MSSPTLLPVQFVAGVPWYRSRSRNLASELLSQASSLTLLTPNGDLGAISETMNIALNAPAVWPFRVFPSCSQVPSASPVPNLCCISHCVAHLAPYIRPATGRRLRPRQARRLAGRVSRGFKVAVGRRRHCIGGGNLLQAGAKNTPVPGRKNDMIMSAEGKIIVKGEAAPQIRLKKYRFNTKTWSASKPTPPAPSAASTLLSVACKFLRGQTTPGLRGYANRLCLSS
ncbi:hypothetical protein C8R46DRAFT_285967 [Mycena filopes]|nr:hypothetical protein C8R46DRAFT_285967 [Mycena filopes]